MKTIQLIKIEKEIDKEIIINKNKILEYTELCKPIAPENSIGRVSRMDAINNKSVVEAALRVAIKKQDQLETIKQNIKRPNFGICKKCKNSIPYQRLLIQPHSMLCVNCAE